MFIGNILQRTKHIPSQDTFEDGGSFTKVGYVSFWRTGNMYTFIMCSLIPPPKPCFQKNVPKMEESSHI